MCLAVPGKLVKCEGGEAVVDMHGSRLRISTVLTPEAKCGDWVLVHAGFAIQQLNEEEAKETFAVLEDLEKAKGEQEATKGRKEERS
jgi:hydrogenase expression/formation protein HypC